MIKLRQSKVVFSENPHGYRLGDARLSGITGLIHNILQLGVYAEASDFVKNVAIPRAGEYGTSVHHAIENWDNLGIKVTQHPKSERFRQYEGDDFWEVSRELETYIRHKQGFEAVANEYTVSDNERYASNIDNVWLKTDTQGIWLVDTKTNNLTYYPGGEEALQEYLSWQLSVYAVLFERQNPGLKVEGLACNWLRKDEGKFWIIERKPDELVDILLSTEWQWNEDFKQFMYYLEHAERLTPSTSLTATPKQQLITRQAIQLIVAVKAQQEEAKRVYDEMTAKLREAMEKNGIKSWDAGLFKATVGADSTSKVFDTKRFQAEHPDLYEQYITERPKKGAFTIKLRDNKSNQ